MSLKSEHFSNHALKGCIPPKLVGTLYDCEQKGLELDREKKKFIKQYGRLFTKRDLAAFFRSFEDTLLRPHWEGFQKSPTCELCGKRRIIQKAHIIRSSAHKGAIRFFESHPANLLSLCYDDHQKLEHGVGRISKTRLERLVNRKRKMNMQLMNYAKEDIKRISAFIQLLKSFDYDLLDYGQAWLNKKMKEVRYL